MDLCERTNNDLRHPWELSRIKVIEKLIQRHRPSTKTLRILDVGCGDGFLLRSMARRFNADQAIGVDIHLSDTDILTYSRDGATLYNNIHQINASFDVILLLDVIEHVADDASFLKDIRLRFAGPDTIFIVTVPAYQMLFSSHDILLKHYRRYNRGRLKKTVATAGLLVLSQGGMFKSLLCPRILQCIKERVLPLSKPPLGGVGLWKHGRWVTASVQWVLDLDNTFLWHLNKWGLPFPGLSLWTVAKADQ